MDDRTLLERAAKAAGMEVRPWPEEDPVALRLPGTPGPIWNPLTDDGDAFRLAVKLMIDICVTEREAWAEEPKGGSHDEPVGADPYAATRRAVVRAAAAIAK